MTTPSVKSLWNRQTAVFLGFIVLLSFLTFFFRYAEPQRVYWDENYHIASAQKYLHGVFFMEQHPPLGKLLIALGEKLLHPNVKTDQFLTTDYGRDFDESFSFAGYRFFPALLAWWTAPLVFLIFLLLTRNSLFAVLFSFLYVFDNALIVHLRGAMLESTLLFFSSLTILFFLLLLHRQRPEKWQRVLTLAFGAAFGAVATAKLVGLVLILLLPVLLWTLRPDWRRMTERVVLFVIGFLCVYVPVWQTHFALGSRIVSELPDNGYYQASDEYKAILTQHANGSLAYFPVMLRDSIRFVGHYNAGTPRLDLCKADENGSPFYLWPLGARSINYRWETPDSKVYRYLYLMSNPVVWLVSFAGVLLGIALLAASWLLHVEKPLRQRFLLTVFVGLYLSYMIAIARIGRVLYLYHYFLPLLLSFFILALVVEELHRFGTWKITEYRKTVALLVFAGLIFGAYEFYRPLTYYEPLTDAQFARRAILPVWELACVRCTRTNSLAVACK